MGIRGRRGTHVTQHVPVHTDEFGEFAIGLVYLARAAPETRGDGHCGEDTIVVQEETLERFLDEYQVLAKGQYARSSEAYARSAHDVCQRL